MSKLQRMGGQDCTYYVKKRCTRTKSHEESEAARCSLLEARRQVGAHTLDRLDRLKRLADPGDREVARRHVIRKNLDQITRLHCDIYVPQTGRGPLCVHQHLIYCLLLMPPCEGRCDYFFLRREHRANKGSCS